MMTTILNATEPVQRVWNLVAWLTTELGDTAAPWLALAGTLLCIVIPYLLGSINPAVLISKIFYHEDIRNFGSGNAGTTNMLRTFGKKAAAATFLVDLGKAAASFWIGYLIWGHIGSAIAGFFVVFGHMFPIFAHFKGGKGVACLAMIALCTSFLTSPFVFLILLGIFIVIVAGTRFISLASIMSAMFYPVILKAFTFGDDKAIHVAMAAISACFVIFMHRENIKRLWHGKESKVNFKKTSKKKINEDEDA